MSLAPAWGPAQPWLLCADSYRAVHAQGPWLHADGEGAEKGEQQSRLMKVRSLYLWGNDLSVCLSIRPSTQPPRPWGSSLIPHSSLGWELRGLLQLHLLAAAPLTYIQRIQVGRSEGSVQRNVCLNSMSK